MNNIQLTKFFEDNGFSVHKSKENKISVAELEMWTNGGVDMIIFLRPFNKKEFISWVNDFDIDEEIDVHRQMKDYKQAFTIRQSVHDFEEFHEKLKLIVKKLEEL